MRAAAAAGVVVLAAWLAGCASTPPPQGSPSSPAAAASFSGRMTVKVDAAAGTEARSVTATFDLQGGPEQGRLDLATPLGTVLAQARWSPGRVALVTPQGERRFASLDALTQEVLGESVPVAALFDWLRGRPWTGAPSAAGTPDGEPGFEQLGWSVSLARYDDGLVSATRRQPPAVTVRAKLDRP